MRRSASWKCYNRKWKANSISKGFREGRRFNLCSSQNSFLHTHTNKYFPIYNHVGIVSVYQPSKRRRTIIIGCWLSFYTYSILLVTAYIYAYIAHVLCNGVPLGGDYSPTYTHNHLIYKYVYNHHQLIDCSSFLLVPIRKSEINQACMVWVH